jgi:hypothetical protein
LKYLVPLLLSEFDGLVTEVVKCFPPIFEHYVVHDYIKNHSILLLHLWSKLEDSSSLKIKQLALKSLFKLCAQMKSSSFSLINKVATKYGAQ